MRTGWSPWLWVGALLAAAALFAALLLGASALLLGQASPLPTVTVAARTPSAVAAVAQPTTTRPPATPTAQLPMPSPVAPTPTQPPATATPVPTMPPPTAARTPTPAPARQTPAPAAAKGTPTSASSTPKPAPALASVVASGIERDATGKITRVFGFSPSVAREVLRPVTRKRPLPADYAPPTDLVPSTTFGVPGSDPVRRIIGDDLAAMAKASGGKLVNDSAYRSVADQKALFAQCVADVMANGATQASADEAANRICAYPGQSQHHLGTSIDFQLLTPAGADTGVGAWLAAHAWEYGFVMSYTSKTEARTGYAYEPWHYRWVGRPLAKLLMDRDYLTGDYALDDYLEAIYAAAGFDAPAR